MNGSGVVWGHAEVMGTRSPVLLQLNSLNILHSEMMGLFLTLLVPPHVLTLLVSQRATQ